MLRGQVAIVLSCSDKFKATLAWPVRDALTSQGLGVIIVNDEPPLPSFRGDVDDRGAKGSVEAYLDASSAFVALCAADYELSDGSKYPRASLIDEIQLALTRPHLQGRCQVLKSPGVLLPSDISPTYLSLDPAKPAEAADVILKQFQEWGVALQPPSPSVAPHRPAAEAADDVDALFDGLDPVELGEARQRIYALLRDRSTDRRRWVTQELHRELTESGDHTRKVAAMSLLEAAARLDTTLVTVEMIESLAAHPGYLARSCAANILLDRAALAPLDVPLEILGRLASPGTEDWLVWAPAMATIQELVLRRHDAYVIFESLAASADPQDRHAVAEALLGLAGSPPAPAARDVATWDALAWDLAERLADDPDPLVAAKARMVTAAMTHVNDRGQTATPPWPAIPAAPPVPATPATPA
jgi:hypothetical protein